MHLIFVKKLPKAENSSHRNIDKHHQQITSIFIAYFSWST